jgi:hypothetical protein
MSQFECLSDVPLTAERHDDSPYLLAVYVGLPQNNVSGIELKGWPQTWNVQAALDKH